jgi:hypothetical protein
MDKSRDVSEILHKSFWFCSLSSYICETKNLAVNYLGGIGYIGTAYNFE